MTHLSTNLKPVVGDASAIAPRTVATQIALVEDDRTLTRTQRRDERSALKRLCDILGKLPTDVPLVPTEFRALIDSLHVEQAPKRHLHFENVSPEALANIKSLCKRTYHRYAEQLRTSRPPMSTAWAALLCLCQNKRQNYDLRRFARFATSRSTEPDGVADGLAEAFRATLDGDPFAQDPPGIDRRALLAWNRGVDECTGWPQAKLTLPRAYEGYCLSWAEIEAISPAFRRDVRHFCDYLARRRGLLAKGPRKALKARSIATREFQLQQAFSIWHRHTRQGQAVACIGDVAQPERAAVVLQFFLDRKNGEPTSQSSGMLNLLLSIARHYAKLGDEIVEELQSYRGMVGYRQIGLTKKNRAMLRQFDSERNLGVLIHLPGRIYRTVRAKRRIGSEDALQMRRAVMVELALVTGMRRGVHSRLRSDLHLQRFRNAEGEQLFLDIDGRETKNSDPEGYPLPKPTAEMLLYYLEKCPPFLIQIPQDGSTRERSPVSLCAKTRSAERSPAQCLRRRASN